MTKFIIFPHQLFEGIVPMLRTFSDIILFEEPIFFFDGKYRPFFTNRAKLAYLRACTLFYLDFLRHSIGMKRVRYYRYEDIVNMSNAEYKRCLENGTCFEYHDNGLKAKLRDHAVALHVIHDSPMFLATKEFLDAYHLKTHAGKHLSQTHFYNTLKATLGILPNVKSTDKENRRALPATVADQLSIDHDHGIYESKYHTAGIAFANQSRFEKHVGHAGSVMLYPCTHEQAKQHLAYFLKAKFKSFGPYQDAISKEHTFLFHSGLSPAMNVGLLTPSQVIHDTLHAAKTMDVPMNSCEGFIRQIVGWRERCMYIFHYHYDALSSNDFWQRQHSLCWPAWRSGETGIPMLDNEIKKAVSTGYAHHIIRLMLFLNVMVLSQIKFEDVYRWFMEVCAMDAFDWVMISNIGSMGYYDPRFMSKPYLATSNYLVKMSDYKLDKQEREKLDALFYAFLHDKKHLLKERGKTQANVYLRNLAFFEKKGDAQQKAMLELANRTRKALTQ